MAVRGGFEPPREAPRTVGLLIGQVYRFQVTGIPLQEGREVFPSLEVIDRLYPPPGREAEFPIPVQLTATELELALNGKMVTRVIYLESPRHALPIREPAGFQNWFEAAEGDDPLQVADLLGRPVAILRLGARVPDRDGPNPAFLFGSPPFERYARQRAVEEVPQWQPASPQVSPPPEVGDPESRPAAFLDENRLTPPPAVIDAEDPQPLDEQDEGDLLPPPPAPEPEDFSRAVWGPGRGMDGSRRMAV